MSQSCLCRGASIETQKGSVQRAPGLVNTWRCWKGDVSGESMEAPRTFPQTLPCVSPLSGCPWVLHFIKNKQTNKNSNNKECSFLSSMSHSSKVLKPRKGSLKSTMYFRSFRSPGGPALALAWKMGMVLCNWTLYCRVYTNSAELALNHTADWLVVAKGKGAGGGVEQEVEVSRCKLFKKNMYLFIWLCWISVVTCRVFLFFFFFQLQHVGSSSLIRDRLWAPWIGSMIFVTGPPGKSLM